MRGWSRDSAHGDRERRVVPAHAGVVPDEKKRCIKGTGGPRACGGGPARLTLGAYLTVWSPRMRGWSPVPGGDERRAAVVPAHAGVVPRKVVATDLLLCGPRACGGGPRQSVMNPSAAPWSPRMRGWSQDAALALARLAGGPRACGGGPDTVASIISGLAWSPRMRGWSHRVQRDQYCRVVVPAHAGVVPSGSGSPRTPNRGPRACGGGPRVAGVAEEPMAWSPRMRGCPFQHHCQHAERMWSPAHAGVVPACWPPWVLWSCGPRACRGGPGIYLGVDTNGHVVPAHAGVVPATPGAAASRRCGPRAWRVGLKTVRQCQLGIYLYYSRLRQKATLHRSPRVYARRNQPSQRARSRNRPDPLHLPVSPRRPGPACP